MTNHRILSVWLALISVIVAATSVGVLSGVAAATGAGRDPSVVVTDSGAVHDRRGDRRRVRLQGRAVRRPPVGDLRWQPRSPPRRGEASRDATDARPAAAAGELVHTAGAVQRRLSLPERVHTGD